MKLSIATTSVILAANLAVAQTATVTNKQTDTHTGSDRVEYTLAQFAKGELKLQELYDDNQKPLRLAIIRYFQQRTNTVPVEQKLLIAACMGKEGNFEQACDLLVEYVRAYTNSARGWSMLGTAASMTNKKQKAVEAYQRAVALGDERALLPLVADALEISRLDIASNNVPKLLELRKSHRPPKFIKLEITGVLAMYAQASNNEDLFVESLEGLQIEDLLERKDVAATIAKVCEKFNSQKAKEICEKLKLAQKRDKTRK